MWMMTLHTDVTVHASAVVADAYDDDDDDNTYNGDFADILREILDVSFMERHALELDCAFSVID